MPATSERMSSVPQQRPRFHRLRRVGPDDVVDDFPPLTSVRPAGTPDLYLERQRECFCGLHALNAALGGPVFTQNHLDSAAQRVVNDMYVAAIDSGHNFEESLDRHRSRAGMYSEQALSEALLYDGRWHFDNSHYLPPSTVLSNMCNENVIGAVVHRVDHWVALRAIEGVFWLLTL